MFLSILNNRSGDEFVRRIAPGEVCDLRAMVAKWVDREFDDMAEPSFSEPGSHIPNGCADYQAEIRYTKKATGSCWDSEPFYINYGED